MPSSQLPISARYGCSAGVTARRTALRRHKFITNKNSARISRLSRVILPP
jgi:hypothetical protein